MAYMINYNEADEWESYKTNETNEIDTTVKTTKTVKTDEFVEDKDEFVEDEFDEIESLKKKFRQEFYPRVQDYNRENNRCIDLTPTPESVYLSWLSEHPHNPSRTNEDSKTFKKRIIKELHEAEFYACYKEQLKYNPINFDEICQN